MSRLHTWSAKPNSILLELNVTSDCMIPRPETELLVERAIEFLRTCPVRNADFSRADAKRPTSNGDRSDRQFVCDLCTGCGCIAVAIAKNCPDADIIATDISDAALKIAAQNIEKYRLDNRTKLLCGDLFDAVIVNVPRASCPVTRATSHERRFDLIVCNPPYVSAAEFEKLGKNIRDYEPKLALLAGIDGLDIYRRICEKADQFLKPDAALMLEVGYSQGQAVRELLERTKCFTEITIEKDYHDNNRVVTAKKVSS